MSDVRRRKGVAENQATTAAVEQQGRDRSKAPVLSVGETARRWLVLFLVCFASFGWVYQLHDSLPAVGESKFSLFG